MVPTNKILVVDDNAINRRIFREIFYREYVVLEASDGEEALETIRKEHNSIKAVVLDIILPKLDGFAVLKYLKKSKTYSQIPILIATSIDDSENEINALDLGADDLVVLPVDSRIVYKRVTNLIRMNEMLKLEKEQKRLKDAEAMSQYLQLIFDKVMGGIAVLDSEDGEAFRLAYCNLAFMRSAGVSGYGVPLTQLSDNLDSSDFEALKQSLRKCETSGETFDFCFKYYDIRRKECWAHLKATQIRFLHTDRPVVLCLFTDITETKRIENELKDTSLKLTSLLNNIQGGIAICEFKDNAFVPSFYNENTAELLGYSRSVFNEKYSHDMTSIVHPADLPLITDALTRSFESGAPFTLNFRVRAENGALKWIKMCASLLDRTCKKFYLVFIGINEEKQTELKLKESQMMLQSIYDNMQGGISLLEIRGKVSVPIYQNKGFYELFGSDYRFSSLRTRNALELLDEKTVASAVKQIRQLMVDKKPFTIEYQAEHKTKGLVWLKTLVAFYNITEEGYPQILTVSVNIDELKETARRLQESTNMLQSIMANLPTGIVIYSVTHPEVPLYVSALAYDMLGFTKEEFFASFPQIVKQYLLPQCTVGSDDCVPNHQREPLEVTAPFTNFLGEEMYIRLVAAFRVNENGEELCYCSLQNVTASIQQQRQRTKQDELYRLLIEETHMMIFDYDVEKQIIEYSFLNDSGIREVRRIVDPINSLHKSVVLHPDSVKDYIFHINSASNRPKSDSFTFQCNFNGEGYRWFRAVYTSLADNFGKVFRIVGRGVDIHTEHQSSATLKAKAETDMLSGLFNRMTAEEMITAEIVGRAPEDEFVLFLFDIDLFKNINDNYGHPIGDKVIKEVGNALRKEFMGKDIIGRMGGDEFAVFFKMEGCRKIVEKKAGVVQASMAKISKRLGLSFPITISLGIALQPSDGKSFSELFANADKALYSAKNSGKNCFCFFEDVGK